MIMHKTEEADDHRVTAAGAGAGAGVPSAGFTFDLEKNAPPPPPPITSDDTKKGAGGGDDDDDGDGDERASSTTSQKRGGAIGRAQDVFLKLVRLGRVEERGIAPIPLKERTVTRTMDVFTLWWSMNVNILG